MQCSVEQISKLKEILFSSEQFREIFHTTPKFNLPNWYVGAGFLVQTVWNHLSGYPLHQNIKDVDLIYFDDNDLSEKSELEISNNVNQVFKSIPLEFDVVNQARVHTWYADYFGYPIEPYISSENAIKTWPTFATAVAVRNVSSEFFVYAPFGLDDVLEMRARPNKVQITKEIYLAKVERWKRSWPHLNIVPWESE